MQSHAWTDRMLGRWKAPVRAVARERLVLPETLAHPGVYQLGDEIALLDEEFQELRQIDRADPTPEQPWRCHPRSVFTPEEYETDRKHGAIKDLVCRQDRQNDAENKERWERRMAAFVKFKVLRNEVHTSGNVYRPGQIGELPYWQAKGLADRGLVEIVGAVEG